MQVLAFCLCGLIWFSTMTKLCQNAVNVRGAPPPTPLPSIRWTHPTQQIIYYRKGNLLGIWKFYFIGFGFLLDIGKIVRFCERFSRNCQIKNFQIWLTASKVISGGWGAPHLKLLFCKSVYIILKHVI